MRVHAGSDRNVIIGVLAVLAVWTLGAWLFIEGVKEALQ
jgi:hypothetical protein